MTFDNLTHARPPADWQFRPDIEGLRAVAITGVVLFHAGIRRVSGGFLGVDVFFVVSGFLITGILITEVQKTGGISLGAFWARRARRLLPAATLMSLVTLLISARVDSPFAQATYAKSAAAFATYWSNLLFVRRGADYFDQAVATDPFLHTWSLGVEEQYYLIFAPLCVVLALGFWSGGPALFRRRLLISTIVVSVASFVGCLMLTAWQPLVAFYDLPARAWEFGVGGMLALSVSRANRAAWRWQGAIAVAGLAALGASWFLASDRTPHPGWITLLPVLGTAALIESGGHGAPTPVARLLETPFLRWLGRLSYSWYLWHWPLAIYWDRLVPNGLVPIVVGMPLASLALAQLTFVVVETPARVARWLQGERRGLLVAFVLAVVTIAAAIVSQWDSRIRLLDPRYQFIIEARDTPTTLHREQCHLSIDEVEPKLDRCVYGVRDADTTIVLMGDSHAAQWFAALEAAAVQRRWRIVPMTKSACPAVSVAVWLPAMRRTYAECDRWRLTVFDRLAAMKPAVIVLASSEWLAIANGHEGNGDGPARRSVRPTPELWQRSLRTTLDRLPPSAAILLLADTPNPHFNVPNCLFEYVNDVDRCAFRRDAGLAEELRRVAHGVAQSDARVTYLDATDHFCDAIKCSAAQAGLARYSDGDHISVRYSASLAPVLLPVLDSMVSRRRYQP
ncbi:MAG TPA: acyltransferase family protein [Gemmatimonadaceae bacterium]|nr:acyltransferase family protein [Gemmatimonadaceae bacterium]